VLNFAPILIVEDEPYIALELQLSVEDAGGEVVGPVGTTIDALILLETCMVAAAILDVQLRDRDVTPVAEALSGRNVPMVFHTAQTLPPHLEVSYPHVAVYRMPVAAQVLLTCLAEMIGTVVSKPTNDNTPK
jgi:CheY-like chemotaxis protein